MFFRDLKNETIKKNNQLSNIISPINQWKVIDKFLDVQEQKRKCSLKKYKYN